MTALLHAVQRGQSLLCPIFSFEVYVQKSRCYLFCPGVILPGASEVFQCIVGNSSLISDHGVDLLF